VSQPSLQVEACSESLFGRRFSLRRIALRALSRPQPSLVARAPIWATRPYSLASLKSAQPFLSVRLQKRYASDSTAAETRAEPEADDAVKTHEADDSIVSLSPEQANAISTESGVGPEADAETALKEQTDPDVQESVGEEGATIEDTVTKGYHTAKEAVSNAAESVRETVGNIVGNEVRSGSGQIEKSRQPAPDAGPERRRFDQRAIPPSTSIWIGNLFFDVNADMLTKEFGRFGNIVTSRINYDARGMSRGYVRPNSYSSRFNE